MIPTLTLRDSNRQGLLGMISFAIFAGLENMFLVRGDAYGNGSSSDPKNVYDIRKVSSFIELARKLEVTISMEHSLCILSPINLLRSGDDAYLKIVRGRENAGVDILVAEQMFEDFETYLDRLREIRESGISCPIVHSVFPFKNYYDAVYCIQKFGWKISETELQNLKEEGARYGLEMARKRYHLLFKNKELIQGVSISTRGNPEVARYIVS